MTQLSAARANFPLALLIMTASGFAGLGYQIIWTQQSALWLGHESIAVLATVGAFFGGLACGAWLLGERIARSTQPARWYAGCEIAIALWSCVLAAALHPIANVLAATMGPQPSTARHASIAFCGTFLVLLPATAAMGATLPAMQRWVAAQSHAAVAALYASNTFGAMLGTLVCAFCLIPWLGLSRTTLICAALNAVCGLTVLALSRRERAANAVASADLRGAMGAHTDTRADTAAPAHSHSHMLATLAATGFLGIGYEVLVVRVLSQVAANTVFTFAILLAVYLLGTALGAALLARLSRRRLLWLLAGACLLGTLSLTVAPEILASAHAVLPRSFVAALAAEVVMALAAFLLPTVLMGALFAQLSTAALDRGLSFGRVLTANTLGAALAPAVCGVLLLPLVGAKNTLLAACAGYVLLVLIERPSARAALRTDTSPRSAAAALTALTALTALAALVLWAPDLRILSVPPGGRVIHYEDGAMASVSVVRDTNGIDSLHIDNHEQEGSSATRYADARQALLPILLHPAPRRALFLGLGTGVTASAATLDPALQVDAVELLPEVIRAAKLFASNAPEETSAHLRVLSADARRFVRSAPDYYDVIVADNFHPARSGSASLYTAEHFAAVRARLAPGGLFCQWLPLHQLDLETLRSIVRTYLQVYPQAIAILATNSLETPVLGLVAKRDEPTFNVAAIAARFQNVPPNQVALQPRAAALGLGDSLAVAGSIIADASALARFSAVAPVNTDDHPIVSYLAPRITYAPTSTPRDRLLALLSDLDAQPEHIFAATDHTGVWNSRISAYWHARNQFLVAGSHVVPTNDVEQMLAQVREPLLAVLRISPEFAPAYDPLLRMAQALSQTSPERARALQRELGAIEDERLRQAD